MKYHIGLTVVLIVAACGHLPVYRPPPRGSVRLPPPPAPRPGVGPTLDVVTFEDGRRGAHRDALSAYIEDQGGWTGEAVTRDIRFDGDLLERATDYLAAHLAAQGFARVHRIDAVDDGDADLVLTARVRRLRGWQGYRAARDQPVEVVESLGDVFIDRIEVVNREDGALLFVGQAGTLLDHADVLDPYALMVAALDQSVRALAERLRPEHLEWELEREVNLLPDERGGMEALGEALPAGWRRVEQTRSAPVGWAGDPVCDTLRLEDATRTFFHPRLGDYRPTLTLWSCPADYQARTNLGAPDAPRFPAEILGRYPDGAAVLWLSLGKSSWPGADEELLRYLGLERAGPREVWISPRPSGEVPAP